MQPNQATSAGQDNKAAEVFHGKTDLTRQFVGSKLSLASGETRQFVGSKRVSEETGETKQPLKAHQSKQSRQTFQLNSSRPQSDDTASTRKVRKCWVLGKIGILQRVLINLGFLITLTMAEQQLASNTQCTSIFEGTFDQPDLVVIDLPGTVNQLGNAHDRKILNNISNIANHCLSLGCDVIVTGNERSRSWNLLSLCSDNSKWHVMTTNWCHFNIRFQQQLLSRSVRVVSNRCLPLSHTSRCSHEAHVTLRNPGLDVSIEAMTSLVKTLLEDRAESKVKDSKGRRKEQTRTYDETDKTRHALHTKYTDPDNIGDHAFPEEDVNPSQLSGKRKQVIEDHFDDCGDCVDPIDGGTDAEHESDSACFFDMTEFDHYSQFGTVGQTDNTTHRFDSFEQLHVWFKSKSASFQRHDVAQLFGGHGNCLTVGVSFGLCVGMNFDVVVGIDLLNHQHIIQFEQYLKRHRPRVLICSPPCTAFGPWSNLNRIKARKTWLRALKLGKHFAAITVRACEKQLQHGAHFLIENPWSSHIWKLDNMQKLTQRTNVHFVRLDQCMYGLKDPTGQRLIYKPTGFLVSHPCLSQYLQTRCDRRHSHVQVAGQVKGQQMSKAAQVWPRKLNEAVIQGVLDLMHQEHVYAARRRKPVSTELTAEDSTSAPSSCPGCRSHLRKDDPRHNRHPGVCKFPEAVSKHWKCIACQRHAPSTSKDHSRILGTCQWAEASTRRAHPRAQGEAPTEVDGDGLQPTDTKPPRTPIGDWKPMTAESSIRKLQQVSKRDGWTVINGWPTLVVYMGSLLKTCAPHYKPDVYPLRTTYGLFPECDPQWWFLETGVAHVDLDKISIGYQVPVLVMMYHSMVSIPHQETQEMPQPRAVGDDSDIMSEITGPPNPSIRSRRHDIPVTPPGSPRQDMEGRVTLDVAAPAEAADVEQQGVTEEAPPPLQVVPGQSEDWSSWQLGRALKSFRSDNHAVHIRAIRQMHLRFWHASSDKLQSMLRAVGISKSIIDLIPSVVNSCRVCRLWQRPLSKSVTTTRLSNEFNQVMQIDLLFVEDNIICHMLDEATRFTMAVTISSKRTEDIQAAVTRNWIRLFGPPDVILSDQEGGLHSESSAVWAERLGTSLRFKARNSHAQIVERHHEMIRVQLHKMLTQIRSEGIDVSFEDVLSEAVYAKNIMTSVHGVSPFQAVFGRFPRVLTDMENTGISAIDDHKGACRHASRIREIAIAQIVEGISYDRLRLAESSKTRVSGEELNLKPGDQVDIYRSPQNKDLSGWRGPCIVVNTLNISDGYIDVKWQGRTMSARIQDTRRHIPFVAFMELMEEPIINIREHLQTLTNTTQLLSVVPTTQGWLLSQAARQYPLLFRCLLHVGRNFVHLPYCIGARIGRGVSHAHSLHSINQSILVWYESKHPEHFNVMYVPADRTLKLNKLFTTPLNDTPWIQFLSCHPEDSEQIRRIDETETQLASPISSIQQPRPISSGAASSGSRSRSRTRSSATSELSQASSIGPGHPGHPDDDMQPARISSTEPSLVPASSERTISDLPIQDAILTESSSSSRDLRIRQSLSRSRSSIPSTSSRTTRSSVEEMQRSDRSRSVRGKGTPAQNSPSELRSAVSSEAVTERSRSERRLRLKSKDNDRSDANHDTGARGSNEPAPLPIASSNSGRTLDSVPETIPYEDQVPVMSSASGDQTVDYGEDDLESLASTIPEHHEFICSRTAGPSISDISLLEALIIEQPIKTGKTDNQTFSVLPGINRTQFELQPVFAALLQEPVYVPAGHVLVYTVDETEVTTQIEKDCDTLTAQDLREHWDKVETAIRKELKSFDELKVLEAIDAVKVKNVMSSRWVLRWKMIDQVRSVKARLTVRGFEDLCASSLEVYAGTATRWSQRLICSMAVQRSWTIFTWDVSTAFLQGCTFKQLSELTGQPLREVAFRPPKGSEKYFKELSTVKSIDFSSQVLLMLKPVYGLKDAPRAWRLRLDQALKELHGKPLNIDPAIYIWTHEGHVSLVISTHVDDMKGCGEEKTVMTVLSGLEARFGKIKVQTSMFEHCGIVHEQQDNIIRVHQNHYSKQLKLMSTLGLDINKPSPLNATQKEAFVSLLGGCSWLIQTRMDIAVYVGALQRASKKATSVHYFRLNTLVRWIKRKPFFLTYRKLVSPVRVVVVSDSAFRKEDVTGLALRGAIVGLSDYASNVEGHVLTGNFHVVDFYSRRQRRVVRSTYGAELNALADAIEFGRLITLFICECMQPGISIRELARKEETGGLSMPLDAVIDAKSVFDSLKASETRAPNESSLFMILLQVKELLRSFALSRLFWCDTRDMVSDGLNKGAIARTALLSLGKEGRWVLSHSSKMHTENVQVIPEERQQISPSHESFEIR